MELAKKLRKILHLNNLQVFLNMELLFNHPVYTCWAKSMATVNVKCLGINCNTTFGQPCIYICIHVIRIYIYIWQTKHNVVLVPHVDSDK